MITTLDMRQAKTFPADMGDMIDIVNRLKAAGKIDGYSPRMNDKRERILGVRVDQDWAYFVSEA